MSHLSRNIIGFQRELAEVDQACARRLDDLRDLCQSSGAAAGAINHADVDSSCYCPLPDRYAPTWPVSVAPFYVWANSCWNHLPSLEFTSQGADDVSVTLITGDMDPCLTILSQSQRQPFLAYLLVPRTLTPKTHLSLLAPVRRRLLLLTNPTVTRRLPLLVAALVALWPTIPAFLSKSQAPLGRIFKFDSRARTPLARLFSYERPKAYV